MSKVALVSKSAFAKMQGVSPAAVTKAIDEGRITVVLDGDKERIDPAVAQIQWSQNTRPRAPSGNAVNAATQLDAPAIAGKVGKESIYWDSRASREQAEAAMAQLELAEMQKTLIQVDAVKSAISTAFAATREAMLQIPSRIAASLAAEGDAQKIQQQLSEAIHAALSSLSSTKQPGDATL